MIKVNNQTGSEVWLVPTARRHRRLLLLGCLKEPLALSLPRAAAITLQQVNDCSGWAELFDVSVFPVNVSVICPSLCSAPIYDWKQTPAAISTTFSRDTLTRFWWSGRILRDGTKTLWIFILRGCIVSYRFPVMVNILLSPPLDVSFVFITTRGIVLLKEQSPQNWYSNHLKLARFSWDALVTFSNTSDLSRVSQRWGTETDHLPNRPPTFSEAKCFTSISLKFVI